MSILKPWLVALIYGLAVIASGMIRYLGSPGGDAGLWFGVVMGGLAVAASGCFWTDRVLFGTILTWFTIAVVGGWFVFEALIEKGIFEAEVRMLAILGITFAAAVYFLPRLFQSSKSQLAESKNTDN